ncbi:MAG: M28 family peptidase, partial [Erysipelotrichales bacterium]|nr:M28 family peptidase [Erysipelotrichales bacterium]
LEKVLYCINIDMIGSILGHRIAVATANEDVVHYTQYYADIHGFPLEASQGVYSSDSTPFADCGVPSISFARITPRGGGDIHNRFDVIEHLSKRILGEDTEFIVKYADTLINAYAFPIKKEMPQKMKDEIDKYYMREKKEK